MNLEKEYEALRNFFGEKNLLIEYFYGEELDIEELDPIEMMKRMFNKVKITHLPSGKIITGTKSDKQIENAISALIDLKAELAR